jgi:DAACS family dicarboxylate/amino acid:cation (Na+ or H+) symporter
MMKTTLQAKMLIGILLGSIGGIIAFSLLGDDPRLTVFIRYVTQPAGQVFIRLLFMLVIPLIFSALALGVAGLGDLKHLGRVGFRTLIYTVAMSVIAVLLGIAIFNALEPGAGISSEMKGRLLKGAAERAASLPSSTAAYKSGIDLFIQIVPDNPIRAAANGDMLAVMFFSLMIGISLALNRSGNATRFREFLEGLYETTMRLITMVISFAPLGVAALLFTLTAQLGYEILWQLARYVTVVLLALALHQFVAYSLSVRLLGKMKPMDFFRGIEEAMVTAFSTASSNATLPTSLKVAEEKLHLPPHISRFVLTIGSTLNQNGTALFEGVTVLFLAQFYGVPLNFAQQALVVSICILGGIGTAGIPAGSIPVVAMILGLVGIPIEGIGIILGVDRLLDMCRTVLNVTGDLAAAVVVSRGEKHVV